MALGFAALLSCQYLHCVWCCVEKKEVERISDRSRLRIFFFFSSRAFLVSTRIYRIYPCIPNLYHHALGRASLSCCLLSTRWQAHPPVLPISLPMSKAMLLMAGKAAPPAHPPSPLHLYHYHPISLLMADLSWTSNSFPVSCPSFSPSSTQQKAQKYCTKYPKAVSQRRRILPQMSKARLKLPFAPQCTKSDYSNSRH